MPEYIEDLGGFVDGPIFYREFNIGPSGCIGVCPDDLMHKHNRPHIIHILEGRAKVAVKADPPHFKTLNEGDTFLVEAFVEHLVQAVGGYCHFRCEFFHYDKDGNRVPEFNTETYCKADYDFAHNS